jgi:hypothetical protein
MYRIVQASGAVHPFRQEVLIRQIGTYIVATKSFPTHFLSYPGENRAEPSGDLPVRG